MGRRGSPTKVRRYGIRTDPRRLAREMWEGHAAPHPDDLAADLSRLEPDASQTDADIEEN